MNTRSRSRAGVIVLFVSILALNLMTGGGIGVALATSSSYYIDCANGNDANNGTSPSTPWKSISKVNNTTFAPGQSILFKRGVTCSGSLRPKGSGTAGSPITIGAYGTGALPIINGGSSGAAIKLYNQEYWHIQTVETTGGTRFGINIGGDGSRLLHHFRVTNVVVHDVIGDTVNSKQSGLIVIAAAAGSQPFDDVIIDGATAYNTNQWMGIRVGGSLARSTNVTIRNATVHDVYGDGIVLFEVNNGLIETSVAWNTGKVTSTSVGAPNGIWSWRCGNCIVQFNEGYRTASPGSDGGVYDIDWGSSDSTVQYNYAHDAQGYCVAVFGAESTTTNSTVRYNICANNARGATQASQGDIFIATWNGGSLDGVQIYNNTISWNPAADRSVLNNTAVFMGTRPNFFKNNIIYSTVRSLINTNRSLKLNNNLYWYTGSSSPKWSYNGVTYTGFNSYRSGSGQDSHGLYSDPKLNAPTSHSVGRPTTAFTLQSGSPAINAGASLTNMGSRDFFGNAIPQGGAYDIGAYESGN